MCNVRGEQALSISREESMLVGYQVEMEEEYAKRMGEVKEEEEQPIVAPPKV